MNMSRNNWQNNERRSPNKPLKSISYGIVPPQDIEAENAVIGALILEKKKIDEAIEILQKPEVFYSAANGKIFQAICEMHQSGIMQIDMVTISDHLKKLDALEAVGGIHYLFEVTRNVVSSAHLESHCRIIMQCYLRREIIRVGHEAISDAYENSVDVFDLLDRQQADLYNLSSRMVSKDYEHISKDAMQVMKDMDEQRSRDVEFTGVITPFNDLTRVTGGWQPGLIVVAARPGVGKTSAALLIGLTAAEYATTYGCPVGIFSLEMRRPELLKRLYASNSGVLYANVLFPKKQSQTDIQMLIKAQEHLSNLPIYIDDTPAISNIELRSKVRRMVSKQGVRIVIVDYLQLMTVVGNKWSREQEVAAITGDLKRMSSELGITVIALSQLNRGIETRSDKTPNLSDLRESGSIEQDADMVMMAYGFSKEDIAKDSRLGNLVALSILKHRNGTLGEFLYKKNNHIQRWGELDAGELAGFSHATSDKNILNNPSEQLPGKSAFPAPEMPPPGNDLPF